MKAIRVHQFGEPDVMQLEEVAELHPSEDQILVKVKAIGVNPVDTYIRSGIYAAKPQLPYTPGLDASGIIDEIGPEVKHRKVGERIYLFGSLTGCYAEKLLCSETRAYPLPDNATFSAGAAMGVPYGAAYYALLYRTHAMPGETVLVHGGSGAVGLAAIQIATAMGCRVVATAGTLEGLALVRRQGAIAALNHNQADYLDALNELTCGQGVDVIVEMLANVNLEKDLNILAKHGRIVVIGNRGRIEIDPRAAMGRDAAIFGMSLFNASERQLKQIHAALTAGLANSIYKPVINIEMPLTAAAQAHVKVMKPGAKGKIILIP